MRLPTMLRMCGEAEEVTVLGRGPEWNTAATEDVQFYDIAGEEPINITHVRAVRGADFSFGLNVEVLGGYEFELTAIGEGTEAAQLPVTCFFSGIPVLSFVFHGTDGKPVTMTGKLFFNSNHAIGRMHFSQDGLRLVSMRTRYLGTLDEAKSDPEFAQGS